MDDQDIGQLQADVITINTELARQTHFRGYFTTNDEILSLANPAIGDYAYSAEDLLVWDYDGTQWIETDKIVPDQMTPASDANPQADGTVTAGISTEYSRGDHVHPLNITSTIPVSDSASGAVGTANQYARSDHSHPINISTSIAPQDSTSGSVGTTNYYARSDHSHPINVQTNASIVPIVNGVGSNGTSTYYARQDHIHPQQLTYDGNVTATKFIKTGGLATEILCANGDTTAISTIDNDSVKKTGKPLQIVQEYLRYADYSYNDDEPSVESDDDDYQTRGQIYSQYVNKSQTETIIKRKTFKNSQLEIQQTGPANPLIVSNYNNSGILQQLINSSELILSLNTTDPVGTPLYINYRDGNLSSLYPNSKLVQNYVLNAGTSSSFAGVKCGVLQWLVGSAGNDTLNPLGFTIVIAGQETQGKAVQWGINSSQSGGLYAS
ncbi:MAG: hypothetical protein EZS28_003548 [Streblomastix strix]|uniref:Uncharacterized protein n=1 Tax=Streblomastix strix TaxID=222440 RepID=A0A5J4X2F5_9EUKA|nr:MAG: hypothetical protein EZS28_003548 [Streblomastix strix]